jgi:hypothetical protein
VVNQALVDDLGARLGSDVAAQIDVELSRDLQIVGGPGAAYRVVEIDASATGDGDERVGLGSFAIGFQVFEVHTNQGTNDLKVAEFFGADIE